jgi:transcriptional regulator with XRE-family HTH domain
MGEHEDEEKSELGRAVTVLRTALDLSQEEVAEGGHISAGALSNVEQGKTDPKRQTVEAIVAGLRVPRSTLARAVAFNRSVAADREALAAGGQAALLDPAWALAGSAEDRRARASVDLVAGVLAAPPPRQEISTPEAAGAEARALWVRLEGRSAAERRALVEELPEFWSWPLSALVSDLSAEAAAGDADEALELAELALEIARRMEKKEGFEARVEGRAWAYLGNARRVRGDLPEAGEAFAEHRRLWLAGRDPEGFLDPLRLLDLEASLRREQRRFAEAHELLDRALEARPLGTAAGRVLLIKAKTFEAEKNYESAIATLDQAAPQVEAGGDPRLRMALRSHLIEIFLQLGRIADAERTLAEAKVLAAPLGKALDEIRLRWLEGRLAAAAGRPEEAVAILSEVRAELAARRIAYDTALVTLELAVLLAEQGRTVEVKALAEETAEVFKAQRVARERFAALQLFVDAARQEALTAELARRLLLDLRDRA